MKIALITTLPSLEENQRIEEEAKALGHQFKLVSLKDFGFTVKGGKMKVDNLSDLDSDVVIVRGIFNSIKAISTIINHLRKKDVRIFDNNFLEHRYSIDKVTDLMKLSLAGVPVPDMVYSRDYAQYQAAADKIGYPLVIKSTRMGKGADVYKLEKKEELVGFVEKMENQDKKAKSFIIQEYIPYIYDLRCLVVGKDVFTMRRIPAEEEFRANFSLGGEVELFDLDEKGKALAIKALKVIDMSVSGVDILITKEDKRYILEVNHTAGFVGMEKATGVNIGKLYLEHAIKTAK